MCWKGCLWSDRSWRGQAISPTGSAGPSGHLIGLCLPPRMAPQVPHTKCCSPLGRSGRPDSWPHCAHRGSQPQQCSHLRRRPPARQDTRSRAHTGGCTVGRADTTQWSGWDRELTAGGQRAPWDDSRAVWAPWVHRAAGAALGQGSWDQPGQTSAQEPMRAKQVWGPWGLQEHWLALGPWGTQGHRTLTQSMSRVWQLFWQPAPVVPGVALRQST